MDKKKKLAREGYKPPPEKSQRPDKPTPPPPPKLGTWKLDDAMIYEAYERERKRRGARIEVIDHGKPEDA